MTSILTIFAAILMLGIMIAIHEWGHFIAARACGIAVKEFAIGFGPKILSWKSKKHETAFALRIIPLGGYCMFYGEDDAGETAKDDPRNLRNHNPWKRMLTIFMGPMMNFVLAFVVAVAYYGMVGVPKVTSPSRMQVSSLIEGGAAQEAGLLPGDIFLTLEGQVVDGNLTELIADSCKDGAKELSLTVLRGDSEVSAAMTPRYDDTEKRFMLGVNVQTLLSYQPGTVGEVTGSAFKLCVSAGKAIAQSLGQLVTTGQGFDQMSGPVGVVQLIVEETRAYQLEGYLWIMLMISVNLGLVNLLPIPGLDGSRILFLLLEVVRRKPIDPKKEAYVHLAGYALLLGLMLVFTFKDILKLF